ncbi:hypothetical protein KUA24_18 [Vibrio phage HNL01]|nr:hypothetical protein KUA24_18 [Vibrio phage HNL01]
MKPAHIAFTDCYKRKIDNGGRYRLTQDWFLPLNTDKILLCQVRDELNTSDLEVFNKHYNLLLKRYS